MSEAAPRLSSTSEKYTGLTAAQVRDATARVAGIVVRHSTARTPAVREHAAMPPISFEEVANQEHTVLLRDEVINHGATIDDNGIRRPNTADFMKRHGFDRDDMDAVGLYRGSGARSFNDYLRGTGRRPIERAKYERFMALFAEDGKMPVTKGGEVVYRGMPDLEPGSAWQEEGFSSTTVSVNVAKGFARSAQSRDGTGRLARMVMPPGVRYLPMGTGEEEAVFESGLTMTPFGYNAFESGIADVGTVDVLVQKTTTPSAST